MKKGTSTTALVRKKTEEYLEENNGEWIRQKDIVDTLSLNNTLEVRPGIFNGIFMRHIGSRGVHVPIPNVEIRIEGNRAYFHYVEPKKFL